MTKTGAEKPSSTPITGKALLQKVESLRGLSRQEIARLYGYYTETKDHQIRVNITKFYEALLVADGIAFEPGQTKDERSKGASVRDDIKMTKTIDITDLAPEQIEQISTMIDSFRAINKHQNSLTEDQLSEFDPTPLFFESEILQPFNRSLLYGNRT